MTQDEIEAVRADLIGLAVVYPHFAGTIGTAAEVISHLLARAEQAERERDEALDRVELWKSTAASEAEAFESEKAEVHKLRAQLAARDAAIAEAIQFCCLTLAFIGRDRGTVRMDRTLNELCVEAAKTEKTLRQIKQPDQAARARQARLDLWRLNR